MNDLCQNEEKSKKNKSLLLVQFQISKLFYFLLLNTFIFLIKFALEAKYSSLEIFFAKRIYSDDITILCISALFLNYMLCTLYQEQIINSYFLLISFFILQAVFSSLLYFFYLIEEQESFFFLFPSDLITQILLLDFLLFVMSYSYYFLHLESQYLVRVSFVLIYCLNLIIYYSFKIPDSILHQIALMLIAIIYLIQDHRSYNYNHKNSFLYVQLVIYEFLPYCIIQLFFM
ncbi:hypothetical protein ABPG72_009412 [Tetrahymena utriculariae]